MATAVARAAMESGVARITFDVTEYRERLISKGSNAAYSIMRTITKEAQRDPRRVVFPHAANARLLRAVQQIVEAGTARPILLGRSAEIEKLVDGVLAANAKQVEDYRAGKEKAFNSLVGQVMKASKGKANPAQVNDLLRRKLTR